MIYDPWKSMSLYGRKFSRPSAEISCIPKFVRSESDDRHILLSNPTGTGGPD